MRPRAGSRGWTASKASLRVLKKEALLRAIVDNVGKRGTVGQCVQNVISVAMLSEGWDAKNVTHILGLRAFSSQLLCEQVIGRGLRRVTHDTERVLCPDGQERWLFKPEYVNVFGVPLPFFGDTGDGNGDGSELKTKFSIQVESIAERAELEIVWPNVVRVDTVVRPELVVDWSRMPPLKLDPARLHVSAELAPALGGAADLSKAVSIDLERLPEEFRLQRLLFLAARKALGAIEHGAQTQKRRTGIGIADLGRQQPQGQLLARKAQLRRHLERKAHIRLMEHGMGHLAGRQVQLGQ